MHVRVDDALDECCSDGSVDRISTASEDSRTGRGGKIVLRREHRATAHYERMHCRHLASFSLPELGFFAFETRIIANCLRSAYLSTPDLGKNMPPFGHCIFSNQ